MPSGIIHFFTFLHFIFWCCLKFCFPIIFLNKNPFLRGHTGCLTQSEKNFYPWTLYVIFQDSACQKLRKFYVDTDWTAKKMEVELVDLPDEHNPVDGAFAGMWSVQSFLCFIFMDECLLLHDGMLPHRICNATRPTVIGCQHRFLPLIWTWNGCGARGQSQGRISCPTMRARLDRPYSSLPMAQWKPLSFEMGTQWGCIGVEDRASLGDPPPP